MRKLVLTVAGVLTLLVTVGCSCPPCESKEIESPPPVPDVLLDLALAQVEIMHEDIRATSCQYLADNDWLIDLAGDAAAADGERNIAMHKIHSIAGDMAYSESWTLEQLGMEEGDTKRTWNGEDIRQLISIEEERTVKVMQHMCEGYWES